MKFVKLEYYTAFSGHTGYGVDTSKVTINLDDVSYIDESAYVPQNPTNYLTTVINNAGPKFTGVIMKSGKSFLLTEVSAEILDKATANVGYVNAKEEKVIMKEKEESIYRPGWNWLGRSLENYKSMHAGTAANKGLTNELKNAKTLTQARKILFGMKRGNVK